MQFHFTKSESVTLGQGLAGGYTQRLAMLKQEGYHSSLKKNVSYRKSCLNRYVHNQAKTLVGGRVRFNVIKLVQSEWKSVSE